MTLTTSQVTEIADDLEALRDELTDRNFRDTLGPILGAAASHLITTATTPAPVTQQYLPPRYPYEPGGYGQPARSVPLQVRVTGGSRQELEDRARAEGEQVFGSDAALAVTLIGTIITTGHVRGGENQYACAAYVRQEEPAPGQARHTQFSSLNDD